MWGILHWVGNSFYMWGYQTVRNPNNEEKVREVFYLNKVAGTLTVHRDLIVLISSYPRDAELMANSELTWLLTLHREDEKK